MKENFYKKIIKDMPCSYAYHKIICDESEKPIDYIFLDINSNFEKYTNLHKEDVINRKISDIIPGIRFEDFDWISYYGNIALNGGEDHIDQYSAHLDKWYRVHVFSPEKYYFITCFTDITYERQKISENTAMLVALNDIVFNIDENYIFQDVIVSSEDYLFFPKEHFLGKSVSEVFPKDISFLFAKTALEAEKSGRKEFFEYRSPFAKDRRWFEAGVIFVELERTRRYIVSIRDITHEQSLEIELRNEKNLLKTTLLSIGEGVISVDLSGNIILINHVAEHLTGWKQAEALNRHYEEVFSVSRINGFLKTSDLLKEILINRDSVVFPAETVLISKHGSKYPIEANASPIKNREGAVSGAVIVFRDITDRKNKQEEILYLSYHDQLTGLYNRRFFEEELKRLDTQRNLPISLIMLDVNGLKLTNDAFGHAAGDSLLISISNILKKTCRADDIIARIGGDEFAIVLPKADSVDANRVVDRIYIAISKERLEPISVSASAGFGTKSADNESIDCALKRAEDQMYKRKLSESKSMRERSLEKIINLFYETSKTGKSHSLNVSRLAIMLGRAMDLDEDSLETIGKLGLFHDIGLIAVDSKIVDKTSSLNETEWMEVKRHSEFGYQILKSVNHMVPISEYVLSHHERWDGDGYPDGLKETDIPLFSRILSISDAYDAMTNPRSYKETLSKEEAIQELADNAGKQFDPYLVDLFINKVLKKRD